MSSENPRQGVFLNLWNTRQVRPRRFHPRYYRRRPARRQNENRVATRFPPGFNGYIHIGHAKSVCLNFGIAAQYKGTCNLRMDDTDPAGESMEFVESIIRDIRWLGFDWGDRLFYASDYFEKLYEFAVELIKRRRLCLQPERGRDTRIPRHVYRTGPRQSLPQPLGRRKPRFVLPDAAGRIQRRLPCSARQNRHGFTQHRHARPGALPH